MLERRQRMWEKGSAHQEKTFFSLFEEDDWPLETHFLTLVYPYIDHVTQ